MRNQPTKQTIAYTTKVQLGLKRSNIGRNVPPTTKLEPQLVAVDRPEPRLLTYNGKSSDCCQGTLPSPKAYAATYKITLARTS